MSALGPAVLTGVAISSIVLASPSQSLPVIGRGAGGGSLGGEGGLNLVKKLLGLSLRGFGLGSVAAKKQGGGDDAEDQGEGERRFFKDRR